MEAESIELEEKEIGKRKWKRWKERILSHSCFIKDIDFNGVSKWKGKNRD